ncbi:MAG TPA: VOC family protein [Chloroflexota bacterium]|nr:VOC family protein [Chloroflexota bacterium]
MAQIESISHSGINVIDLKEAEEFYANILGAGITNRVNFNTDDARRGRSVHTSVKVADWLFALALPKGELPMPPENEVRGTNGFRHGFHVSRGKFGEVVERLRARGVTFEGPVRHPEAGPLGESVYFKDPGGNFIEVCWRRDTVGGATALDVG